MSTLRTALPLAICALMIASAATRASAATLRGSVIRVNTLAPVAGATVQVFREPDRALLATATSAQDGSFSAGGLVPGSYRLLVRASYLFAVTVTGVSIGSESVSRLPFPIEMSSLRSVAVAPGMTFDSYASAEGFVWGLTDLWGARRPLAGIRVTAYADSGTAIRSGITDQAGRFLIDSLLPGSYTLRASVVRGSNVAIISSDIDLEAGENALLAQPLTVPFFRRSDDCAGSLFQPAQTADVYVVCGDQLSTVP